MEPPTPSWRNPLGFSKVLETHGQLCIPCQAYEGCVSEMIALSNVTSNSTESVLPTAYPVSKYQSSWLACGVKLGFDILQSAGAIYSTPELGGQLPRHSRYIQSGFLDPVGKSAFKKLHNKRKQNMHSIRSDKAKKVRPTSLRGHKCW